MHDPCRFAGLTSRTCATGVDVLPIFRLLYAQVAASCNGLAHALELRRGLKFVSCSCTRTLRWTLGGS